MTSGYVTIYVIEFPLLLALYAYHFKYLEETRKMYEEPVDKACVNTVCAVSLLFM